MDHSIYESSSPERAQRSEGIAFGRITRVYENERLVEVKTFFGTGSKNDNHIPKCQVLGMDASPDGDESGAIPRVNSFCLVFFVGGEPFAFGFMNPLNEQGSALVGDRENFQIASGDRYMRTSAGNYVILRTSGIVEIQSTDGCRTTYFPKGQGIIRDLIEEICKNYEFTTDGGTIDWKIVDRRRHTLYTGEHRDSFARENIITEKKGFIDGTTVHQVDYGSGADKTPRGEASKIVKTITVKKDGETTEHIRAADAATGGYKITKKPDGHTEISIADKSTFTVTPEGKLTIDINKGQVNMILGEDGKLTITTKADVSVKSGGKIDVESKGKLSVKASLIDLDGGGGAIEDALSYPSAISDFTGLPIQQASSTVKLSK